MAGLRRGANRRLQIVARRPRIHVERTPDSAVVHRVRERAFEDRSAAAGREEVVECGQPLIDELCDGGEIPSNCTIVGELSAMIESIDDSSGGVCFSNVL